MYLSIIFEDFVVILAFELCGQASVMRTWTGAGTFDIHGDEDVDVQWWSAFNFKSESIFETWFLRNQYSWEFWLFGFLRNQPMKKCVGCNWNHLIISCVHFPWFQVIDQLFQHRRAVSLKLDLSLFPVENEHGSNRLLADLDLVWPHLMGLFYWLVMEYRPLSLLRFQLIWLSNFQSLLSDVSLLRI